MKINNITDAKITFHKRNESEILNNSIKEMVVDFFDISINDFELSNIKCDGPGTYEFKINLKFSYKMKRIMKFIARILISIFGLIIPFPTNENYIKKLNSKLYIKKF